MLLCCIGRHLAPYQFLWILGLLDKQLEKLAAVSHKIIMLGDFNIDLHVLYAGVSMDFLKLCISYDLFPAINICRRVTTSSSSKLFFIVAISNIFHIWFFQLQELLLLKYQIILGFQQDFIFVFPKSQHQ